MTSRLDAAPLPPCGARPSRRAGLAVLALALAAGASLAGCTAAEPGAEPVRVSDEGAESVRIKGLKPHLLIHRRRGDAVEAMHDGDVAHAGDLVQISYVAAGNRHGVVVSLDGRGVVTLHHPAAGARPTLVAHGQHALDHAYELDDAQSFERFVFVTAGDEALDPTVVVDAARRLAQRGPAARHSSLSLPDRWQQTSLTLDKRP